MLRICLLVLLLPILTACGRTVSSLVVPDSHNIYKYDRVKYLYTREASFNDDIKMPKMYFLARPIINDRYIKDPLYQPKGGKFSYRFLELEKMVKPSHDYMGEKGKKIMGFFASEYPKILEESVQEMMKNNKSLQKAIKRNEKNIKKYNQPIPSSKKGGQIVNRYLISMKSDANKKHQEEHIFYSKEDEVLTKKWNAMLRKVMLSSFYNELSEEILPYQRKIYLLHKIAINDAMTIEVKNDNPIVRIDQEKFKYFYSLLGASDLHRFRKEFGGFSKESDLRLAIEGNLRRKLSNSKNWYSLLFSIVSPKKINPSSDGTIEGELPLDSLFIIKNVIDKYIEQPKKAFFISKDRPPFISNKFGYLYINQKFWRKLEKDKSLLNAILLHEATHVKFDLLKLNSEKVRLNSHFNKIEQGEISSHDLLRASLNALSGVDRERTPEEEEESKSRLKQRLERWKGLKKSEFYKLDKLEEFIVDGEVFDQIESSARDNFINFMQSRHTKFNRYKVENYKRKGCFSKSMVNFKKLSNYEEIYKVFTDRNSYGVIKGDDCSLIKRILN